MSSQRLGRRDEGLDAYLGSASLTKPLTVLPYLCDALSFSQRPVEVHRRPAMSLPLANTVATDDDVVTDDEDVAIEDEHFNNEALAMAQELRYFQYLTWQCLSLTPALFKHPTHDKLLASFEALEKLFYDAQVCFAVGLADALQANGPLSIAYFKSLISTPRIRWAVYLLVLEKPNHPTKIYIGSGTQSQRGVVRRFENYEQKHSLPTYVSEALDLGYSITQKGLLCWAPIPPAGKQFLVRSLFIVLETTLTFTLWAMLSRDRDYGMPTLCPWDLETLPYDGLCSHSAMAEGVRGDDGLTTEELAAKELLMKQRASDQKKANYYGFKALDFGAWQAKRREYGSRNDPEERRQNRRNVARRNRETGKYRCQVCDFNFPAQSALTAHYASAAHERKLNGTTREYKDPQVREYFQGWVMANKESKRYYCTPCDHATGTQQHLDSHLRSKRHQKAVAIAEDAAAAAKPAAEPTTAKLQAKERSATSVRAVKRVLEPTTTNLPAKKPANKVTKASGPTIQLTLENWLR